MDRLLKKALILASLLIALPTFAGNGNIVITKAGAKAGLVKDNAPVIQKAIDQLSAQGGGTVTIPAGEFLTGPIELKSGVELHLDMGARLLGVADIEAYEKAHYVSPEGKRSPHSALIYANNQENIAITGLGTIDGQGGHPAFNVGKADPGGRPMIILFRECKNIVVRDVRLENSAHWVEYYTDCEGVRVSGIKVYSHCNYNNDGIDLESKDVVVENCIFDCEYCYLQGMYPSGHIVVFVNTEDTFAALDAVLAKHSAYVCISYDTDLLALEPLLHSVSDWMAFAAERPDMTLELRTKSAPLAVLRSLPVLPNVILAITLSPDPVIRAYEHKTPSLTARLSLASEALSLGWLVRLCFDPMLAVHDAQTVYGEMFDEVFAALPMDRIYDASVGVFRISKEYLRTMRKHRPCAVTCYPYELRDGVYAYPADVSDGLLSFARDRLLTVLPKERIFFWESEQEETL